MGTRHLTAVIFNKEPKIAQYGQWDGYPEGAGKIVFYFLRNLILDKRIDEFKEKVNACRFVDNKELEEKYKSVGVDPSQKWISLEDVNKFKHRYPYLDRDMGAEILEYILENGECELINSFDFIKDTLFCEYAYIIDLDNECLEIYGGDNYLEEGESKTHYKPSSRIEGRNCSVIPFTKLSNMSSKAFIENC